MILSNYHTHTVFCDGKCTADEMAAAAASLGFRRLGFSGHGYVPFEGLFHGMAPDAMPLYREAVMEAKRKYAGRLDIFYGVENDSINMLPAGGFDYTIGSVHCITCGGAYYSVDSREDITERAIAAEFGGDGMAYAIAYFKAVEEFASEKRADILGHIDLVRRFNAGGARFFDEGDPRYRRAAEGAMAKAAGSGYFVEVSTSPLVKGISGETYPANFLLKCARELGAKVVVNSDAHSAAHLNYAFGAAEAALAAAGFKERWELAPGGAFEPVKIN